jgi:transcriptional regulator with XRE-family HTH domain
MAVKAQINARSRTGYLHGEPTRKLSLEGTATSFKGDRESVTVTNLTRTGMLLETTAPLSAGEPLQILLPEGTSCTASVVWANETIFACEFDRALTIATIRKIQLQSPPDVHPDIRIENEAPKETLGQRIKRLRRERGFSVDYFASRIGVSRPTLWKWEKDSVSPRQNMVQVIALALGIPENELLYGSPQLPARRTAKTPPTLEVEGNAIADKKAEIAQIIGINPQRVKILIEA